MNDTIRTMLHYIAENDMAKTRAVAKVLLQSNKTQKDQEFCEKLLKRMDAQEAKGVEIPYNLKSIIRTESTPYGFEIDRYYLTGREKTILLKLKQMYAVGEKMASMNIHYSNAVMLYGKSGTGKTTFAQYVAKRLDLPFFYVSITQLIDSYMGKTGQNMENVFQFASTLPCVLVLDEIDQVATRRKEDGGVSGELKRVLDRLPNNVVLIAATNRPETIDEALMRRFPIKHCVQPLDEIEATDFIYKYLTQIGIEWKGQVAQFLKNEVGPRQAKDIEKGFYVPAVIADCLNERIARTLYRADFRGQEAPILDLEEAAFSYEKKFPTEEAE